jgi:hypothetical protein
MYKNSTFNSNYSSTLGSNNNMIPTATPRSNNSNSNMLYNRPAQQQQAGLQQFSFPNGGLSHPNTGNNSPIDFDQITSRLEALERSVVTNNNNTASRQQPQQQMKSVITSMTVPASVANTQPVMQTQQQYQYSRTNVVNPHTYANNNSSSLSPLPPSNNNNSNYSNNSSLFPSTIPNQQHEPASWYEQQQQEGTTTTALMSLSRNRNIMTNNNNNQQQQGVKTQQQQQTRVVQPANTTNNNNRMNNTTAATSVASIISSNRNINNNNNNNNVTSNALVLENNELKAELALLRQKLAEAEQRETALRRALVDVAAVSNSNNKQAGVIRERAAATAVLDDEATNTNTNNKNNNVVPFNDANRSHSLKQQQYQQSSLKNNNTNNNNNNNNQKSLAIIVDNSSIPDYNAGPVGRTKISPAPENFIPPAAKGNNKYAIVTTSPGFWSKNHTQLTGLDVDAAAKAVIETSQPQNMKQPANNSVSLGPLNGKSNLLNNNNQQSRNGSPIPHNPLRGAIMERRFTFTGFTPFKKEQLGLMVASIGDKASVVESGADEPPAHSVTHVVVPERPQSVKALCALVTGKWVVTEAYLKESMRLGFWANEENVDGCLKAVDSYPLRNQEVMLMGVPEGAIRDALQMTVEYGEGRVVPDNYTNRRNSHKYIIITSGADIVNLCLDGLE